MPCNDPIRGWRAAGGVVTFNKKNSLGFAAEVPCGRCMGCRVDRTSMWTTRLMHEAQTTREDGKLSSFITLTFDNAHLPKNGSLDPRHWQLFAKRLRRKIGSYRYYHAAEYGEDVGQRPHHHAIIFGYGFVRDRIFLKNNKQGHPLWISPELTKLWGNGACSVGEVTAESCRYVAKYSLKRITGDRADAHYQGRRPEFATMSLNPAIGKRWLEKWGMDVYPSDETIVAGRHVKTPVYYDKQLAKVDGILLREIKLRRRQQARERTPEQRDANEYILRNKPVRGG